jgi:hypothetical protein
MRYTRWKNANFDSNPIRNFVDDPCKCGGVASGNPGPPLGPSLLRLKHRRLKEAFKI